LTGSGEPAGTAELRNCGTAEHIEARWMRMRDAVLMMRSLIFKS
jgi:hypothetical protein